MFPDFNFTHGNSTKERRDSSLFLDITEHRTSRPETGGRKVVALFEAQNPNGLLARWQREIGTFPNQGNVADAISYLQKYGGKNCVKSWPSVGGLYQSLATIEGHLSSSDNVWSDAELTVALIAYLEMLGKELASAPYQKSEVNKTLREGPLRSRSKGSIEYRMQNFSYYFSEQDLPWIQGYKPAKNVGEAVKARIGKIYHGLDDVTVEDFTPTSNPMELRARSNKLSKVGRALRPSGNKAPQKTASQTTSYIRDPAVVEWVLHAAEGVCELCGEPAPFRTSEGRPFLEVHHVVFLSEGGSDTIQNAVALCPNCHKRCHYCDDIGSEREKLYLSVGRLKS